MNEKIRPLQIINDVSLPNICQFGQFLRAVFNLFTPRNISSQKKPEIGSEIGKSLYNLFRRRFPSNISSQKKPEVDSEPRN